jgi:hypothetical protein
VFLDVLQPTLIREGDAHQGRGKKHLHVALEEKRLIVTLVFGPFATLPPLPSFTSLLILPLSARLPALPSLAPSIKSLRYSLDYI